MEEELVGRLVRSEHCSYVGLRTERAIDSPILGLRCKEVGIWASLGSVGDAYDTALSESFLATLECELLDREWSRAQIEAKMFVFDFIEPFYDPRRRHSALDRLSPVNFERNRGTVSERWTWQRC